MESSSVSASASPTTAADAAAAAATATDPETITASQPQQQAPLLPPSLSACRVGTLLDKFHEQVYRIEALERKVDARAVQTRRRVTNLLDYYRNSHRQSHLRIFVSHNVEIMEPLPEQQQPVDPSSATASTMSAITSTSQDRLPHYKLLIEGKLLVGHLDHESAVAYDAKTGYTPPIDDLDRSKGEQEEPEVLPIQCTHFFSRLVVQLEPIYAPKPHPMSKKKSPQPSKKSSRRGSSSSKDNTNNKSPSAPSSSAGSTNLFADNLSDDVDPATLVRGSSFSSSSITTLVWTRDMSPEDANGWEISYPMPPPPGYHLMPHSVVAKIQLYSHRGGSSSSAAQPLSYEQQQPQQQQQQDLYQPNDEHVPATLKLFPIHRPEKPPPPAAGSSSSTPSGSSSSPLLPLLLENSIHIPQGLSMKEICMAFFVYIRDRQLYEEMDKSIVVCDDTLKSMFGVETFPFYQLQQLIKSRNLFTKISNQPVDVVYICKPETAVNANIGVAPEHDLHTLLQLDMDVAVPALFAFRCRELLRRIKRRELEYSSSRTKARYLLMARRAKNEEAVKGWLDQAVGGRAIAPYEHMQPVLAALAKSTPPQTEARMAAHYDMRMSYLLDHVREHKQAALQAWRLVDACYCSGSRRPNNSNNKNNNDGGNNTNNKPGSETATRKRERSSDESETASRKRERSSDDSY